MNDQNPGYDESQHLITIIVGVCVSLVITTSTLAVLITGISCYVVKKRHNGLVGKNATKCIVNSAIMCIFTAHNVLFVP